MGRENIHCPFRNFDGCTNGVGGNGFATSYLLTHVKMCHLHTENDIGKLRDEIKSDLGLFLSLDNSLKTINRWICGDCLGIHAFCKRCRHSDGTRVEPPVLMENGDLECVIVGIPRPQQVHVPLTLIAGDETSIDAHFPIVGFSLDEALLDRIFCKPFYTVKSIPRSCRLAFSCALKSVLYEISTDPTSVGSWVKLLVLPFCTLRVFEPRNRQERRSGTRKYLQQKRILQALSIWNESGGIFRLLEVETGFTSLPPVEQFISQNVRRCLRKVADGHFAAAVKVLSSSGVAPNTIETRRALEEKHPPRPPPSLPTIPFGEPHLTVERDKVLACIRSFPKGTSCGRDGLRAQHLLDAMSGAASAVATDLMEVLTTVVNLWLQGRCPRGLAEYIASAPLTPLLKPDNGIRPIAVGMIWRRLVSKIAMKGVAEDMVIYLKDFQFGVGVSGGAEAVLHAVSRLVHAYKDDTSLTMLLVDFQNAFNLVDRTTMLKEVRIHCPSISPWVEYLYGQPARLYLGVTHIWSAAGIQQGDPLGPLLFALVLHPLILRIQSVCQLKLQAWYLDDGTLVGDTKDVAKAIHIIQDEGPALGLNLNVVKTELFWPSIDPRRLMGDLFPYGISCPQQGVKLLGGAVSVDSSFIKSIAMQRVVKALKLMILLGQLKDPQCELLLLRACMGISKLMFALRTCPPDYFMEAADFFYHKLRAALQDIVVSDGPGFGDLQWRMATLPLRLGGLGIYSARDVMKFAFVASCSQTKELQNHILRNCDTPYMGNVFENAIAHLHIDMPDFDIDSLISYATVPSKPQHVLAEAYYDKISLNLERDFELTARQRAVIGCTRSEHAKDFLLAIPMEGLGQHMTPVEYRSILRYRLMIPLYTDGGLCPVCKKSRLDAFGDHAAHCKHYPGFKYRHDHVRDILYDVFWRAGVQVKKEAPVSFLTNPMEGRSTLRPADILVYNWSGGKHTCIDVTGVSPMVGFSNGIFEVGLAANNAATAKEEKHGGACKANQHVFIPFAFDTFGFLAAEAVDLLKRVQKVSDSNVMTAGSHEFVYRRLGFAIQKGLAAQFVARLSSIFV